MTGDLSPTKNQVNPQPHPADCPEQGKAVDSQEPGEWVLLDIKLKKTLVCLEMGILLGKRGGWPSSGHLCGAPRPQTTEQIVKQVPSCHCHIPSPDDNMVMVFSQAALPRGWPPHRHVKHCALHPLLGTQACSCSGSGKRHLVETCLLMLDL